MVALIYILGVETKSVNIVMVLMMFFVPTILYLPLLISSKYSINIPFKSIVLGIASIFFMLELLAMLMALNELWTCYLRWFQFFDCIIGLFCNTILTLMKGGE